jgi:hypothetical protein
MISRTRGLRSMSMTFLSSSAVHLNPFCISIYQYIQVCTVHTCMYKYVLVRTGMYWYVPVFRSDLVEQELTWGEPFQRHGTDFLASGTGGRARSTLDHRNIPF